MKVSKVRASDQAKEIYPFINSMIVKLKTPKKSGGAVTNFYAIVLYKSSSQKYFYYSVSAIGLEAALAASADGDIVWVPSCMIVVPTGVTIPAGVALVGVERVNTIIDGEITLSANSILYNLTCSGIISPSGADATAWIYNVTSEVVTGNALSILSGNIVAEYSKFYSATGVGIAISTVESDPTTLNSWDFPTKIVATYEAAQEVFTITGIYIPTEVQGGEGNCAYMTGNVGDGDEWIIYDLGDNYTFDQFVSYHHYTASGTIEGSIDGTTWEEIKNLLPGGAPNWVVDTIPPDPFTFDPPRTYRYIRYHSHTIPLVGGELWLGYFQLKNTTYLVGSATLRWCEMYGGTYDMSGGTIWIYGCEYSIDRANSLIYPFRGDRSTFYALDYPYDHADDIDVSAASIHHTLGTSATQAAQGNHGHELDELLATGIANGFILTANGSDGAIWQEAAGGAGLGGGDFIIYIDGTLAVLSGIAMWVAPRDGTLSSVKIVVGTTGTAGSTIVDVHKNGTTIFTTQANRPEVAFNDVDGVDSAVPDVTSFVEGDVFTIDIDQVATGAANLGVTCVMDFTVLADSQFTWTYYGQMQVETVYLRIYNRTGKTKTIKEVLPAVNTAPTGADATFDVLLNGITSLWTVAADKPKITAGNLEGTCGNVVNDQWADNDYLIFSITQVGSTVAGSNLTLTVVYT